MKFAERETDTVLVAGIPYAGDAVANEFWQAFAGGGEKLPGGLLEIGDAFSGVEFTACMKESVDCPPFCNLLEKKKVFGDFGRNCVYL